MQKGGKGKGQFHNRPNIALRLAAVLLMLVCVSTWMLAGLLAKYTTQDSGSDSARVAKFGALTLTETGDFYEDNKLMIVPGVPINKKAVVNFTGSEMATYVFVEVIPSTWQIMNDNKAYSVTLDGQTAMQWNIADGWTFLKNYDGTYVYYRELAPNISLVGENIIDSGIITVSDQITRDRIGSLTNISIKLRATVVQSGGFDSPEAAWNSIAAKEG